MICDKCYEGKVRRFIIGSTEKALGGSFFLVRNAGEKELFIVVKDLENNLRRKRERTGSR